MTKTGRVWNLFTTYKELLLFYKISYLYYKTIQLELKHN